MLKFAITQSTCTLFCAITCCLLPLGTLKAEIPLERAITQEAYGIIKIRNLAELKKTVEAHPLTQALWSEQMQTYLQPLLDSADGIQMDEFEAEMGVDLETFAGYFDGQLLLAVIPQQDDGGELTNFEEEPDYLILAEYNCEFEKLRDIINASAEYDGENENTKHRIEEEPFLAGTLFIEKIDYDDGEELEVAGAYMQLGNILGMSPDPEVLRLALEGLTGDSEAPTFEDLLHNAPDHAALEQADFLIHINAKKIFSDLLADTRAQAQGQEPNPMMPFNPVTILETLKLENIASISGALNLNEDDLQLVTNFEYEPQGGAMALFQYQQGALPDAAYAPPNAFSVSTANFNFTSFFNELENLIKQAIPLGYTMYQAQLANIRANQGIDLRNAFFENLGTGIVVFSAYPEDISKQTQHSSLESACYIFDIKNRQSMESALQAMIDLASQGAELFTKREFLGHTISETRPRDNPAVPGQLAPAFAYTFTETKWMLCTGSSKLLENVLARKETSANPIWEQTQIADALDSMPPAPVARSYMNMSSLLNMFFLGMEQATATSSTNQSLDPDLRPPFDDLKFITVSQSYQKLGNLYTIIKMLAD